MKYDVSETKLTLAEDETLVAGSMNVYRTEFTFDSSWSEYTTMVAVFKHNTEEREQILENGKCEIPWEVLQNPGTLQIGIYGATSDKVRPTLWAVPKTVYPGAAPCEESREPTPDKWQQILARFDTLGPHIGANGNWYIGDTDTGVKARGDNGSDYILTEADKTAIAQLALTMLPDGDEVSY